jgi:hypothetical protein
MGRTRMTHPGSVILEAFSIPGLAFLLSYGVVLWAHCALCPWVSYPHTHTHTIIALHTCNDNQVPVYFAK